MGMFDFLKKKKNVEEIGAPVEGMAVASSEVPDPTFAEEMLGKGIAIKPAVGKVFAPVDGTVGMVFDTKHAITLTSEGGVEILIHVGLDTVSLNGAPFTVHVSADDKVKKGDLLVEFDMDAIKAAGLETITPVIVCNSDDFAGLERFVGKAVKAGDTVMEIAK